MVWKKMTCRSYILKDAEVTNICANYLRIHSALVDLEIIFGGINVDEASLSNVVTQFKRIGSGLEELKPLVEQLLVLQQGAE